MKQPKYNIDDRVSYFSRRVGDFTNHCHVGYIKQIRAGIFGIKYVIVVAKSDITEIVKEKNILNLVKHRTKDISSE